MAVVQLFYTCLVDQFSPETAFAVIRVLERLGFDVEVARDQTCCGQPALNAGFREPAIAAARHTISMLESAPGLVVIPSGSCGDMMIHQYERLFENDAAWRARARALASRCREFSSLVADHMGHPPAATTLPETTIAYHPSCHLLRGLGIDAAPKAIIDVLPQARRVAVEAEDECCGFGGLFAIKHPEISARMLERKIDAIGRTGADRVVSCDLGCLLQIEGGLHRRNAGIKVQHIAELLDEATR